MRKMKGFTLIELLIVVAIIGIIAAIAIPNLLDAIERSRQKRSISEVKSIANSIQSFSTDYGGYPATTDCVDAGYMTQQNWGPDFMDATGSPAFCPDYLQAIPTQDGWGIQYNYYASEESATTPPRLGAHVMQNFSVCSLGADRNETAGLDDNTDAYAEFRTWLDNNLDAANVPGTINSWCYESDIVWVNSAFQQAPEGKQKKCT
ncbi:MAG TPA: prepilin-type N-terminal cleavage/methylation domain-containing protein [Acidobacteriota bacterium]|nr:prepilin-type N-terminal cleavage/methylation domain-containing protein [Acidobacteriota bacterium]HNT18473.1 prepilin-type N-terminal cleavage/methylation domain-containing protein [Acidobacteriota bacterium]